MSRTMSATTALRPGPGSMFDATVDSARGKVIPTTMRTKPTGRRRDLRFSDTADFAALPGAICEQTSNGLAHLVHVHLVIRLLEQYRAVRGTDYQAVIGEPQGLDILDGVGKACIHVAAHHLL